MTSPKITDHGRLTQANVIATAQKLEPDSVLVRSQHNDSSPQNHLFAGGPQSLVARAVGHAEGTRHATGEPTWAYWGHRDPGNQAWNQGTFSYQHAAASPEEADQKQLHRLQRQAQELQLQAQAKGLHLSLPEQLNGIDLANQAPLAALDRGYIDWLAKAKRLSLSEDEAILWARTWSYWDPDRQTWNAPGLGNDFRHIESDQHRRQRAIATVLDRQPRKSAIADAPSQVSMQPKTHARKSIKSITGHIARDFSNASKERQN